MSTKTTDSKYFGRDQAPLNLEVVRSEGSFLYDANGKEYIDFLAGWCVGNLVWGNKTIEKAIRNSDSPTYIYPGLLYKPWAELAGDRRRGDDPCGRHRAEQRLTDRR